MLNIVEKGENKMENRTKSNTSKELLHEILTDLENCNKDFQTVKRNYQIYSEQLKKVFLNTKKILALREEQVIFYMLFGIELGRKSVKTKSFKEKFYEKDCESFLLEKEMKETSENKEYIIQINKLKKQMTPEALKIYEKLFEYYAFIDTYIPKIAYFIGSAQSYNGDDLEAIIAYKDWLSDYLDINIRELKEFI